MKIGINGYEAIVPRFGFDKNGFPKRVGSSEFCYQLIKYLHKIDHKNKYVIYLPDSPTKDMPLESENWQYKVIKTKRLWTLFGLTREVLKPTKLDVLFSPTHYSPIYAPCPQVISILDVSYKHFPDMFPKKDLLKLALWGKYSIHIARKIITISNSSKNDIINEYKISPKIVEVVHLGIKESIKGKMNKSEFIKKFDLNNPYILFVGTLQPRKNVKRLIEAFSKIESKKTELVIVGRKGWDFKDIIEAPKIFGIENRVKFFENIGDDELPLFYKNAQLFALPSLYEGFGLPILEAMKYGCPVIASKTSSLPEAGGDAAMYFDPNSVDEITASINKIMENNSLREQMIKKGYVQIDNFSWEKSASEVLNVLEEVAGNV